MKKPLSLPHNDLLHRRAFPNLSDRAAAPAKGCRGRHFVDLAQRLQAIPNVILTPHVGGSTAEAQADIASYVPDKLIGYINTGNSFMSVNFPHLQLPIQQGIHRLLHIHRNVPGILAQINNVLSAHG